MSTEKENRLRKFVTIPEMDISISQLIDILEFSRNRHDEIESDIRILTRASKSEYMDRQPVATKGGMKSAIKEAVFDGYEWYSLSNRLQKILDDALNN